MMKDYLFFSVPEAGDISSAARRIAGKVHHTPLLHSQELDRLMGCHIFFKAENFQKVGAFKSRGAVNAVFSLSAAARRRGVCTHSSGNHAQALARAAALAGIPAYIVMPDNAPRVKVDAVKGYGGKIFFCPPTLKAREQRLQEVQAESGALEIHPYDNLKVIEGQATAALEIYEELKDPDYIIAPVGGGGLLSGTALASRYFSPHTRVIAGEPCGADDAYRSFRSRRFVPSVDPDTVADGLLTSLGKYTFPIILRYVNDILTVSEEDIIEAMRLIFTRLKVIAEPSAAVSLATVLAHKERFENKTLALILSGGNMDLNQLKNIFK